MNINEILNTVLTEQCIMKKGKSFYHGSNHKEINLSKAGFKEAIYLTSNFTYAKSYGKYIHEFKVKENLNICNLKSKKDFSKVLSPALKAGITRKDLEIAKEEDWYQMGYSSFKMKLVNVIKNLGYDGFFCWEYSPSEHSYYENQNRQAPSFGLFDVSKIELVKIWDKDNKEIETNKSYKKQLDYSKKNLQYIYFDLLRTNIHPKDSDFEMAAKQTELSKDELKKGLYSFKGRGKLILLAQLWDKLDDLSMKLKKEDEYLEFVGNIFKRQLQNYDISEIDVPSLEKMLREKAEKYK